MGSRNFLFSSAVVYAGAAANVVLMVVFYVVSLRINTEAYGALQAMLSCMFLLFAGRTVSGSYVVIHAAEDLDSLGGVVRLGTKLTALTAIATAALFVAAAPFLRDFLKLGSTQAFFLIGLAAVPCMAGGLFDGILNVQKRFVALSISAVLTPLANVILALALFRNGFHETDVGWIVLGGQAASCLNAFFVDWGFLRERSVFRPSRSMLREAGELLAGSLLFGAAIRLDVFWAKHLLPAEEAGSYAIAASIAIVLYIVTSSMARVTSVSLRSGSGTRIVGASFALIVGVSIALAAGFWLFGEATLRLLVGHSIGIDWTVLLPLFVAITCYSTIAFDYMCLNVLTKRIHVGIGTVLLACSALALYAWGHDAHSIALVRVGTMAAFTLVFSLSLVSAMRTMRSAPPPHPAEHQLFHA